MSSRAKKSSAKTTSNVYKKPSERQATGRWMLIPVAIIFGYLPLVMRTYQYDPMLSQYEWFDDGQVVDVYMASKMFVILVLGFIMLAMFILYRMIQAEKFKLDKILIPLYVYFAGVLVSGILSKYKVFAWGGSFEMFESVPAVLMYVFTAIYIFRQMRDREDFLYFWRIASPGVLIESLICTFQHWNKDFIDTKFAKYLYMSPPYWPQMDTMTTGMEDNSYGTLYNPDFLPCYFAAAIPITAAAFFAITPPTAASGKSEKLEIRRYTLERIYCGLILGFCILGLYGSGRTNGVFVLIITGVIMIMGDRIEKKSQLFLFVVAGVLLVAATIGASFSDTELGNRLKTALREYDNPYKDYYVKNLYNKPDEVEFVVEYKGVDYVFHAGMELIDGSYENPDTGETVVTHTPVATLTCDGMEGVTISPTDETNVDWYATREDDPNFSIRAYGYYNDPVYDEVTGEMTEDTHNGLTISVAGITWNFERDEVGFKYKNHRGMLIDFPNDVEYDKVFAEEFFHFRGHIYNYAIPKLKKSIVFGSGSNTFIMVYPQNDYLTERFHSLDVKPHCFYIQQWIENGLVATMALVVFFVWMALALIRLLVDHPDDASWKRGGFWRGLTLGCLALIVGVMTAWFTNDSNICTSPIDWAGFGLALVVISNGRKTVGKEGK
ncbi:MAG: O-antigen ligase family protein [Lachnospiraceae bacterium]|nr:O-antigen ligase family protein [Lachnospiraceae bacterium]